MFLFLVLLAFALLYVYSRDRHSYWKKRGLPSAKPTLLFGNTARFYFGWENLAASFDRVYKSFPNEKCVGIYDMFKPTLMVKDPQLIGDILITNFGKFHDRVYSATRSTEPLSNNLLSLTGNDWKIVRNKMAQQTFSPVKIKSMHGLVMECTENLNRYLSIHTKTGDPVDFKELMASFVTELFGRCFFGIDDNSINDPESEFRKVGKELFAETPVNVIKRFYLNKKILNWLRINMISKTVERFFYKLLHDTIEYRKTGAVRGNELIHLLVNVRDQELAELEKSNINGGEKVVFFNDDILTSHLHLLYDVGFETTATMLGYLFYEISLNPNIQEKLRAEIEEVSEAHNGKLDYDNLNELPYMEMVISETFRKNNAAPGFFRVCTERYQIPGTDLKVDPGTSIRIPVYSIHHDERYYPNPDKFDPERFTEENIKKRPPHTFLPFGGGPRICFGLRFVKILMKSCLLKILTNYKLSTCKKTENPIQIKARSLVYCAKNGIYLNVSNL